jgi:FG-GAP-like repeat
MLCNFSTRWITLACFALLLASCRSQAPSQADNGPTLDDVQNKSHAAELALEKQEHIWDVEHVAFELERKFGKAFGIALRSRGPEAIQPFCRKGFVATLLNREEMVSDDLGYVQQDRWESGRTVSTEAAVEEFSRHLQTYFATLSEIKKVTFRVLDLHAENDDPKTGKWDVTLYIAAIGHDDQQQFVELVSEHQVKCFFLNDEAIQQGEIIDQWAVRSELIRRAKQPLFEEATERYGLATLDLEDNWNCSTQNVRQYRMQMAVEDFDQDGYYDLAIASFNGRWHLLKSVDGRRFDEVTDQVGLPAWSVEEPRSRAQRDQAYLATWIDFNNDSFPDLILGDRLYQNESGKRFIDVTDSSGLVFGYNPRGCAVADYDCDGRLDLYVLYQNSIEARSSDEKQAVGWVGEEEGGVTNHLWRNVGGGRFVNTTGDANAGGGERESFAASWFYANDDHFPDLYIANDFGTNALLINQGNGKFKDVASQAKVADYSTSMGVATGDVTGDGRPEIYVANMFSKMGRRIIAHVDANDYPDGIFAQIQGSCAGNRLYTMEPDGLVYDEVSDARNVNAVGWAYAPALADFDADGQLDIYATTGFLSYQRGKPDG